MAGELCLSECILTCSPNTSKVKVITVIDRVYSRSNGEEEEYKRRTRLCLLSDFYPRHCPHVLPALVLHGDKGIFLLFYRLLLQKETALS